MFIYCPCFTDQAGLPANLWHERFTHPPGDVFFCPWCQAHSCATCAPYDIECKYCSNCLTNYANRTTNCTKTCFDCPKCTSTLSVAVSDEKVDGKKGKKFKFRCPYCSYKYATGVITKPKSLASIVEAEQREKMGGGILAVFEEFGRGYKNVKLNVSVDSQVVKNLELAGIGTSKGGSKEPRTGALAALGGSLAGGSVEGANSGPRPLDIGPTGTSFSLLFPRPKHLLVKKTYKCPQCNHALQQPTDSCVLVKFLQRWNGVDYMPNVAISSTINNPNPTIISPGRLTQFLVHVVNPLAVEMTVSMSILSKLPSSFVQSNKKYTVHLTLPVTNFVVGGDSKDVPYIKRIPTPFLTQNTKVSRAEHMMRIGLLQFSPDDSIDVESSLVEKGYNWVLAPFSVTIEIGETEKPEGGEETGNSEDFDEIEMSVPFYTTVESKLPDEIRQLGLSKKGLKYGFWSVVPVGKLRVLSEQKK